MASLSTGLAVHPALPQFRMEDPPQNLFRTCGPVDHVVVTAAQLKSGAFKPGTMDDVRSTPENKFWGAWRVARAADIR